MSAGVDLSARTLYDQICAYTRFINEAPGLSQAQDTKSKRRRNGQN